MLFSKLISIIFLKGNDKYFTRDWLHTAVYLRKAPGTLVTKELRAGSCRVVPPVKNTGPAEL
ncbi:MAG: hypothetical protein JL50_04610 [Peptococcaceae bacterium BICA1-7]|nr:MAG: hypothetical protein JL50_04610 [Peptococcaceae bacterium BICA1-7]HBV95905.1 hypothetical protein [Desulfotomaculum sp.]